MNNRFFIIRVLLLLHIMIISSCSDRLAVPQDNGSEIINGLEIKWRSIVTPEQQDVVREIVSNMTRVQGGFFVMGATEEQYEFSRHNEYPLKYVQLSDYYICRYEITDTQYEIVVNTTEEKKHPLLLSWDDWQLFLKTICEISGLKFDLPTEAQWEYAARGGQESKGYIYPGSNILEEVRSASAEEGSTKPNELGIFNMADLKSEWCKDHYFGYAINNKNYDHFTLEVNPYITGSDERVVRGGNYRCIGDSDIDYFSDNLSSNRFGVFHSTGSYKERQKLDYRYCRITARSYQYIPEENMPTLGASKDIGCRLVVNVEL